VTVCVIRPCGSPRKLQVDRGHDRKNRFQALGSSGRLQSLSLGPEQRNQGRRNGTADQSDACPFCSGLVNFSSIQISIGAAWPNLRTGTHVKMYAESTTDSRSPIRRTIPGLRSKPHARFDRTDPILIPTEHWPRSSFLGWGNGVVGEGRGTAIE